MQLSVKGKQLDVGEALRTHISEILERILDKYFGDAIDVGVTLSRSGHLYRAHVMAHVGRGIQLQASGAADGPYTAFDTAAEHLAKRLRRHKRRLRHHHKGTAAQPEGTPAQQYILAEAGDHPDNGDDTPVIVAEMTTEIPNLTVGEAVMRMDLADLPAMLFRNSSHSGLNMVYRRADGHIGWIDPRGNRGGQA